MHCAVGMRLPAIVVGLTAAVAACGGGNLGSGGTAGTSGPGDGGTGGTAGTSGIAGTTGSGGSGGAIAGTSGGSIAGSGGAGELPGCYAGGEAGHAADYVEVAIVGADEMAVVSPMTAAVTVTAIDSCGAVTCPSSIPNTGNTAITPNATRIGLRAADATTWTLYLRNTAMPSSLIKVGDSFDMTVQASVDMTFYRSVDQTVVLAHGSNLVMFASIRSSFNGPPPPQLDAFGITVTNEGASCVTSPNAPPGFCVGLGYAARVTVGADAATFYSRTRQIGWLTFTIGEFSGPGPNCTGDSKSRALTGGFRTP
jgi:hypothetical protein